MSFSPWFSFPLCCCLSLTLCLVSALKRTRVSHSCRVYIDPCVFELFTLITTNVERERERGRRKKSSPTNEGYNSAYFLQGLNKKSHPTDFGLSQCRISSRNFHLHVFRNSNNQIHPTTKSVFWYFSTKTQK